MDILTARGFVKVLFRRFGGGDFGDSSGIGGDGGHRKKVMDTA